MISIRKAGEETCVEEINLGDIAISDDKATLVPLNLVRNAADGPLTVDLSATISPSIYAEFDLFFQAENENLRQEQFDGAGAMYFNELFNRTGFVTSVIFGDTAHECNLILVLIPKLTMSMSQRLSFMANMSNVDDTSPEAATAPINLRDFAGTVCFSYRGNGELIDSAVVQDFPIVGRYCCTLMSTDLTELSFDDCEPNQTYVREFSIWNR